MLKRRRCKRLINFDEVISARYRYGLRLYKKDALGVKNISGGGINLILPVKLKVGTIVDIDINLKDSREILPVKGKVCWSHKSEKQHQNKACYETGIMFTEIDPLSISKIYTYFQEHNLKIELI
jgi:Tfp pilus assembly protein PilZ